MLSCQAVILQNEMSQSNTSYGFYSNQIFHVGSKRYKFVCTATFASTNAALCSLNITNIPPPYSHTINSSTTITP